MDVRCERCRTEYEFDDDQISEAGVTVKCTSCQHIFKVAKKSMVVNLPVKPDELPGTRAESSRVAMGEPTIAGMPAFQPEPPTDSPRAGTPSPEKPKEWRVRQLNGNIFTCRELTTLQKWIVERKISRDDEISLTGETWKRLGNIAELASFFQVVETADRALAAEAVATIQQHQQETQLRPAPSEAPAPAPAPVNRSAPREAAWERGDAADQELLPDEMALVQGNRTVRNVGLALAALGAIGGGYYFFIRKPEIVAEPVKPPEVVRIAEPVVVPTPAPAAPGVKPVEATAPVVTTPPAAVPTTPPGPTPAAAAAALAAAGAAPAPAPAVEPAPAPSATTPVPGTPVAAATTSAAAAAAAAAPAPAAVPPTTPAAAPVVVAAAAPVAPPPAAPKVLSFEGMLDQANRLREAGRREAALELYEKAGALQPGSPEPATGKAYCLLDMGNADSAIALFEGVLRKNARYSDAFMGLAEAYKEKKNNRKAIEFYRKYLDVLPDGPEAAVARTNVERLGKEEPPAPAGNVERLGGE